MNQLAFLARQETITRRMHRDFGRLQSPQNVAAALEFIRRHPPPRRVIYFYVVDEEGRLQGVIPPRRLLLSPLRSPLTDIMTRGMVAIPREATLLDACEFFALHGLLAFPIVDEEHRILGVIEIDAYTEQLCMLDDDPKDDARKALPALAAPRAPLSRYGLPRAS